MTFKDIKVGESFISCYDGLCYTKLSNYYAIKQGDYHTYTFAPDDLTHSGSNDPDEAFAICVKNQRPHSC